MIKFREEFLIRVLYKSGNSERFWVKAFDIFTDTNGSVKYKWSSVTSRRPIEIGIDEIEAVWQLKTRLRLDL